MATLTAPINTWAIRIVNGKFIFSNKKIINLSTKTAQLCIPYSVQFIVDSLASFGLLSSLFSLDQVKQSCALLVQHKPSDLCTVIPTCVLDLTFDITVYIKSKERVLHPGALQIALIFIKPVPGSEMAWDVHGPLETMAGQRLYENVSEGTVKALKSPDHLLLSGEAIRRSDGTYDILFRSQEIPCMVNYSNVFASYYSPNEEILPRAMEITMLGQKTARLTFRPGHECTAATVSFRAEISPTLQPKVLFSHFLNWMKVNYDCQVMPLYPEQEEVVKARDWARFQVNTKFMVSTAVDTPLKMFVCGLGEASFLVADPGIWNPSGPCLVTVHNISNQPATLRTCTPVAVGLLLYCCDSRLPSRDVCFCSETGRLEWGSCVVESSQIFSWPHATQAKSVDSPKSMDS
ncbi:orf10 [Alcelaphine gammaherpesvirus 2]|uniref:Orf10 n=1 Tax=Alcelaphine gammaherpesvirus 2 TaxID=138184 RepID=A0A068ADB9_9GAMA|nr:orf10 [Alcelaphine gammaherpesvirus 2]AIA62052.1 orf10 [Alcelaphine gammaherpesvirus 2]